MAVELFINPPGAPGQCFAVASAALLPGTQKMASACPGLVVVREDGKDGSASAPA